jgi:heptosyltransferase-1
LPVLAWLKSADPHLVIDWLVEEGFSSLLEGHPLVHRVHRLGLKGWRRQGLGSVLRGICRVVGTLRREHYDLVLDLQGNSKSGFFTLLSGAKRRYGFDPRGVREWPNLLATNCKVETGPDNHHISERSLAVAKAAMPGGKDAPLAGPVHVRPEASATIHRQLEEFDLDRGPLVVLQYGTTWPTKLWPLDCWRELVRRLCDGGGLRPVLIWGNEEEQDVCREIYDAVQGRAVIWPRCTLPELAALLQKADLVVGGDTGPIHIAAAVGTATVSLFRVTDAERNGPRGKKHIRLQSSLDCSPCLRKKCDRDGECGHSIEVDQVFDAIGRLLPEM